MAVILGIVLTSLIQASPAERSQLVDNRWLCVTFRLTRFGSRAASLVLFRSRGRQWSQKRRLVRWMPYLVRSSFASRYAWFLVFLKCGLCYVFFTRFFVTLLDVFRSLVPENLVASAAALDILGTIRCFNARALLSCDALSRQACLRCCICSSILGVHRCVWSSRGWSAGIITFSMVLGATITFMGPAGKPTASSVSVSQ